MKKENIFKRIYRWYRWNIRYELPDWCDYSPNFFIYDLWLTLTGRQRGVEYVEAYLDKLSLALTKIALYDESDRIKRVRQWEYEVNVYLNNIHCKCNNLTAEIGSFRRKGLRFKDYVYVLGYLRIMSAKSELENEGLENDWESVNLDGLDYKQQRDKILAMHSIKPKKIKFREWEDKELYDAIYNFLKEEFREISKGYYIAYGNFGGNPHYLKLLNGKNAQTKAEKN